MIGANLRTALAVVMNEEPEQSETRSTWRSGLAGRGWRSGGSLADIGSLLGARRYRRRDRQSHRLARAGHQEVLRRDEGGAGADAGRCDRDGNALAAFGGVAKAGVAVAGVAVAAFAANSIKAASDLGEAVNQSNVVFEGQAKTMEAWAATGAEAFGLSKAAALEAASGFGLMLQSAGLAVNESAKLSRSLVQLAGDLASFKNVDPSVALEKLRGGLAGEAEPLRQFGIFLSEAAVQAKAMQSGIASAGEELTDAQRSRPGMRSSWNRAPRRRAISAVRRTHCRTLSVRCGPSSRTSRPRWGRSSCRLTISLLEALRDR